MLIKNLLVKFSRQEGDKIIFQTENGAELSVSSYLLTEDFDKSANYYLSVDKQALVSVEESQKNILNDLIGNEPPGR